MGPTRRALADGRWIFQHGPIDLVIGVDADAGRRDVAVDDPVDVGGADIRAGDAVIAAALQECWARFADVLPALVTELPMLRRPVTSATVAVDGPVARRMAAACLPHRARYITPMAAVAGAVADHLVGAFDRPGIRRAYLNNGGDIALHLAPGQSYSVGLFADLGRIDSYLASRAAAARNGEGADRAEELDGRFTIGAADPVRGIATSGWRGRSFSLGIADSVTVLARDAASADAAATMIANAVDVEDERIVRRPASEVKDDTDLGDLRVTVDVPVLPVEQVVRALERGRLEAERLRERSLIHSAFLFCQGRARAVTPQFSLS